MTMIDSQGRDRARDRSLLKTEAARGFGYGVHRGPQKRTRR